MRKGRVCGPHEEILWVAAGMAQLPNLGPLACQNDSREEEQQCEQQIMLRLQAHHTLHHTNRPRREGFCVRESAIRVANRAELWRKAERLQ